MNSVKLLHITSLITVTLLCQIYSSSDILQRPEYLGTFTADSTMYGGELHCTWDAPQESVDSIRIWFDFDTIPLEYEINLPQNQARYVSLVTETTDTIRKLDSDSWYFLGLQICKNSMWSYITENSRTLVKTAVSGSSFVVINIISIDTSWFENTTNSLVIQWYIDSLNVPGGGNRTYQAGYTIALDTAMLVDTSQRVSMWRDVTQKQNITTIPLYPEIVFDTTWAAGLWLRSYSVTLGPERKSRPTDSSICQTEIPSFTWQEIVLFPDTLDQVSAANSMITFKKNVPFTIVDTIRAFHLQDTLPEEFIDVGGVPFTFNHTLQIPPIVLGMKYDKLPPGVTEDDLWLYQYKNDQLEIMSGCSRSDSTVWDTVESSQLAYPFLLFADTTITAVKSQINKSSNFNFHLVNGSVYYTLPVSEPANLIFAMYSVSGKKVWETNLKHVSGNGRITLNGANGIGEEMLPASGMYILQMEMLVKNRVQNCVTKKLAIVEQ